METVRTISIKPDDACFGVACNNHQKCGRYTAVEGRDPGIETKPRPVMGTCVTPKGEYPLFVQREAA